jgi:hypothetical protein
MMKRLTAAEKAQFDSSGWVNVAAVVPGKALEPLREAAEVLRVTAPHQDMLSGIHNAFGYHACREQAWSFLDVAENHDLLDCVEDVLGPDIVLWDSELYFHRLALWPEEASIWPADPLAGCIAAVATGSGNLILLDIVRFQAQTGVLQRCGDGIWYVIRYMPATSLFDRDPRSRANRRAAEVRPLINYAKRPLWLARGEDRRGNDFATGFALSAARWIDAGAADKSGAIHSQGA